MTFEVLFITLSLKLNTKNLEWLSRIWSSHFVNEEKKLGKNYYDMLSVYGKQVRTNMTRGDAYYILDSVIGKTFFWLANLYNIYETEERKCGPYYSTKQVEDKVELVHRFAELIDVIDND